MQSFIIVLNVWMALVAANPLQPLQPRASPGCIPDNCLRALTVSNSNLKTIRSVLAISDCSTVLSTKTSTVTIVPTTTLYSTITTVVPGTTSTTTTLASTVTETAGVLKRSNERRSSVAPFQVPTYASPCSNVARFSSACSCAFGQPTVTVSTTVAAVSSTLTVIATSITDNVVATATATPVANQILKNADFELPYSSNTWNWNEWPRSGGNISCGFTADANAQSGSMVAGFYFGEQPVSTGVTMVECSFIQDPSTMIIGTEYTVSFWIRASAPGVCGYSVYAGIAHPLFADWTGSGLTTEWQLFTSTFVATATSCEFDINLNCDSTKADNGFIEFDNGSFIATE